MVKVTAEEAMTVIIIFLYLESTNSDWMKLANSRKTQVSNTKCHTENRFSCYDLSDKLRTDINNAIYSTERADLFYADKCIKDIFAKGEFIKISFTIILAMLINLI